MQKTLKSIAVCLVFLLASLLLPITPKAFADNSVQVEDDFDRAFLQNVSEIAMDEPDNIEISARKIPLYDIALSPLGYAYNFVLNGTEGFAVVIKTTEMFGVAEINFQSASPYIDENVKNIFIAGMQYAYYVDGVYYTCVDGKAIGEKALEAMSSFAVYAGAGDYVSTSEYVYYSQKSQSEHKLALKHPGIWVNADSYGNSCAPIAGANLIQYWDRYRTDLIEDYTPGLLFSGQYIYKDLSTPLEAVVSQLYTDMGTNTNGDGTSVNQFKAGMQTYCERQGYSVSFGSCKTLGFFNYASAKQKLDSGLPLVIFVTAFTVADISQFDDYDYISYMTFVSTHAMAGFGYREITYTLSDGSTRYDRYLAVAGGQGQMVRGYFNVDLNTNIDEVLSVTIS